MGLDDLIFAQDDKDTQASKARLAYVLNIPAPFLRLTFKQKAASEFLSMSSECKIGLF